MTHFITSFRSQLQRAGIPEERSENMAQESWRIIRNVIDNQTPHKQNKTQIQIPFQIIPSNEAKAHKTMIRYQRIHR